QVVARAVDQEAVLVELEVAAPRVQIDAAEHRLVIRERARLLDDEVAVAVDRHVRAGAGVLDVALLVVGGDRVREDAAGDLLARQVVGHEVLETRLDALVGSRLGIGDVAGDVLQGKRLGAQTGQRGRKSVEDTHDCSPLGSERPSGASTGAQAAILAKPFASSVPELIFRYFNGLPSRQPRRAGLGGKILQAWRQKM